MSPVPSVSIGLPVYNGERSLPRALDSLLSQSFQDFELIISDNASDDATPEICRRYAIADPRIRYSRNATNIGLFGNFNRVAGLASGEYFKWATHDDWWAPEYLSRCVEELSADPEAVLCVTGVVIVDGDGEAFDGWTPRDDLTVPEAEVRFHRLIWSLGETHPIFGLIRTDALRRTGLFRSFLGSDRVILADLALQGQFRRIPDPLHYYTVDAAARAGRTYSVYNDPRRNGRLQFRTWRLCFEHLRTAWRADIGLDRRLMLACDVMARFGLRESRRMAAEVYHSGRILLSRT